MSETSIIIRLATPDDLAPLASVIHDSFVEYRSSYTNEGFAVTTPTSDQLLQRLNEGPIWIATKDETLLGTVSAVAGPDHVYIRGMAVLPYARGLGVGALLLKTIEDFAKAQGHKLLTLSTTPFLSRHRSRAGY